MLDKIADYLLLRSSYSKDISLFHGKMGMALSLYLYAEKSGDNLLKEYTWDLFLQVHESVHTDMPVGLECGLAGIGVGTVLLCQYSGQDCNFNDILAEVDTKIMERDPRRLKDMSLRTGMAGLLYYLSLRGIDGSEISSFDKQYISELYQATSNCKIPNNITNLIDIVDEPSFTMCNYLEEPLGIDGGSSYYLLKSAIR